ncbi:transcription termination/antitermination protein NusG [Methylocystis bryophila]|uniref:NusG-like N-terminal domain-containing protein n=1 Tax=Methylocystis bryophila TaxID=655015 RepID=A0A1W6MT82_9HYPH|nr:transcription termination/antitermination NusG family protein [Methylocystis bryophila]ARN80833.1 hypothetical protein B1812_06810 [Methylocystis bryophila]BDV40919.1 hypothetical protein DSM21852_41720 [Methylocystis bryophila]
MKKLGRQAAIGLDDDLLSWYVVEVRNGREGHVCRTLLASGLTAWRPVRSIKQIVRERGKAPRAQTRRVSRFGSYVFLQAERRLMEEGWLLSEVLNLADVLLVVREAGSRKAAAMPRGLVEFYRNSQPAERDADCPKISEGCKVRILVGPASGREGIVARVDRERVLRLTLLDPEGGPTPATIICEVGHVDLLELCRRPPTQTTSHKAA